MILQAKEIARILGIESNSDAKIETLLTDSRDLMFPESTVFVALSTASNDGHRYIAELYDKGVRHFIAERRPDGMDDAEFWIVDDALAALQTIGRSIRKESKADIVGITGSRGKTIVKEMLHKLIGSSIKSIRAPRSYNSQIGVPLSAWEIGQDTDVAIFEAGISRPGEMSRLRDIIGPRIGIFTSITDEHGENFDSLEQKALEKAALFTDSETVFYPEGDDVILQALAQAAPNARAVAVASESDMPSAVLSALASAAANELGCHPDDPRIEDIKKISAPRIEVFATLKNCLIVYDAFTLDMRSIADSLNFSARNLTPGRNLTAVISKPADANAVLLGEMLAAKGFSRLIGIGFDESEAKTLASYVGNSDFAKDADEFLSRYTISDFNNEVILLKGEPDQGIEDIKTMLETPRHETVMEVDLGAIADNFNYFRSLLKPNTGLVAMVKADGYGIGALELAKAMQSQGASFLAVAVIDEGAQLRRAGITMPIIVMNPIGTNYKALFDNRLEPSVFSIRELSLLHRNARRLGIEQYPVHIKLDTGMHRLGFIDSELEELTELLGKSSTLKVASIFSHLATADCVDQDEYTQSQLDAFEAMSGKLINALGYKPKRHILNTAGIMRYPSHHYDMARLGIGLYGISPVPELKANLNVVASLSTTIISIKKLDEGDSVGYGRKGRISRPSIIATIPIGYADGLDRHLSCGHASFIVNGVECPVVGNICMDQCMIDVTNANASIGDKVEIFGRQAPIERLSDTLGTIPYEILTSISPRVKRIYFRQ